MTEHACINTRGDFLEKPSELKSITRTQQHFHVHLTENGPEELQYLLPCNDFFSQTVFSKPTA